MIDTSRHFSNEWLTPILDEAKLLLNGLSPEQAIQAAVACHLDLDWHQAELPYDVVFGEDEFEVSIAKLLKVIKTPTGITPALSLELQEPVAKLHSLLAKHQISEGMLSKHASFNIIEAISGKQNIMIYTDHARNYPVSNKDWMKYLTMQYPGLPVIDLVLKTELGRIMSTTAKLAKIYFETQEAQELEESAKDKVERHMLSLKIFNPKALEGAEGLAEVTRQLQSKYYWYCSNTYEARGLKYSTE